MTAHLVSPELFARRIDTAGLGDAVTDAIGNDPNLTKFGAVAAVTLDNELSREKMYSIPFPNVVGTGVGYASDYNDRTYTLRAGLANIRSVDRHWLKHRESKDNYRVLDFGCGTGRLLRYVCEFGSHVEPIGCDVNPKAVTWLKEAFPCTIHHLDRQFDLSFLKAPVDLIYAWSIFTHFSEDEHTKWLKAMTAALNPGGLLIATFKSPAMLDRAANDEAYRKRSLIADYQLPSLIEKAEKTGFVFFECYDHAKSLDHGIDAETFGQTYISHDYIRENWSEFGDVIEIGTAVPNWQDLVVLRV